MNIGKAYGYIEQKSGNKHLIFASTDKNKSIKKKNAELWDGIKYLIKAVNGGEVCGYEKDFMKSKLNSDDSLPLNKILKLHNLTIVIRSVFQEDNKYYPQVLSHECLHEL